MRPFPRTARPRPATAPWRRVSLAALVGVLLATLVSSPMVQPQLAAADDHLKDRHKHVKKQLSAAHDDLSESSARLRNTTAALETARANLASAQSALASARARLQAARIRDEQMQQELDQAMARLEQARTEALPDVSLGLSYTHSEFLVSGDNPNSLGLQLSLPLPLFDRNQANIGRAALDRRRTDNESTRLEIEIRHQVADAVRRTRRSAALLDVFEGGGMLERADTALKVAERSYKSGAVSLLELLEAQRTYIETREQYLRAQHEYRQAVIDVMHAVAGDVPGVAR